MEYKEYIEQWIHDIKNPLATVKLICDNNRSEATTKILIETSRINNYIEQALYYARSANVEKDYLIREVLLSEIISKVLVKNKQFLIENGTHILMNDCNNSVLTDENGWNSLSCKLSIMLYNINLMIFWNSKFVA